MCAYQLLVLLVDAHEDLVLPLAGLGAPQPDLILAEPRRDVGDHAPHVQPLSAAVVAPKARRHLRRKDQPQLLAELLRQGRRQGEVPLPEAPQRRSPLRQTRRRPRERRRAALFNRRRRCQGSSVLLFLVSVLLLDFTLFPFFLII